MWNTNDDRNSKSGHFLKMCLFLKIWKHLYIETYPQFFILSIFWKCGVFSILSSLVFLTVGQCGILTLIDTPILAIFWKCGNFSVYRCFHISRFCLYLKIWKPKMWKCLYTETTWGEIVLRRNILLPFCRYQILVQHANQSPTCKSNATLIRNRKQDNKKKERFR